MSLTHRNHLSRHHSLHHTHLNLRLRLILERRERIRLRLNRRNRRPPPHQLLTIDMITREAVHLFRNATLLLKESDMPARSKAQQMMMGADLARARAGKRTRTGMSTAQLEDFASTKRKGLPTRVKRKKEK